VQGLAMLVTSLKSRFPSRVLPAILVLFFLAWMVYCVNAGAGKQIKNMVLEGGGFTTRTSRENDVVLYIKNMKLDQTCKIYTNFVEAVYFMGDMQSSKTLSRKGYAALVSSSQKTGKPVIWPQEEKACLVWFDERINPGYIPAEELKAITRVEALAELKYGAVYSLAPK